jgi:hypothetical protein
MIRSQVCHNLQSNQVLKVSQTARVRHEILKTYASRPVYQPRLRKTRNYRERRQCVILFTYILFNFILIKQYLAY